MLSYEELPAVNSERWFSLEDLPGEVWKEIPGYNGLLLVSNYSRIMKLPRHWSPKKAILTQINYGRGYLAVSISINRRQIKLFVHRLVASAFVNNEENKRFVDHIDTNKLNNIYTNLRWVTHKENINNPLTIVHMGRPKQKAYENNLCTRKHDKRIKKVAKYNVNGDLVCVYNSLTEAAKDNKLAMSSISNAAHGKIIQNKQGQCTQCKTAGGYKWVYL